MQKSTFPDACIISDTIRSWCLVKEHTLDLECIRKMLHVPQNGPKFCADDSLCRLESKYANEMRQARQGQQELQNRLDDLFVESRITKEAIKALQDENKVSLPLSCACSCGGVIV